MTGSTPQSEEELVYFVGDILNDWPPNGPADVLVHTLLTVLRSFESKWTHKLPTQKGFYWMRWDGRDPDIVYISTVVPDAVAWHGSSHTHGSCGESPHIMWSNNPIRLPEPK